MKKGTGWLASLIILVAMTTGAWGQEIGNWGLGINYAYDVPMAIFSQWQSKSPKIELTYSYIMSRNVTVEVEYQHAQYDDGKLEDKTFVWPIDGKAYLSPNAQSTMTFNSLVVNGLVFWRQGGRQGFQTKQWAPFIAIGAGFYDYSSKVSGMIYPGQRTEVAPGAGPDPLVNLEPFEDTRTALGANIGLGLQAFIFDNIAVDIRGRYNYVMGQLRPMEAWGIDEGVGIQFFDLGTGIRFYFE